MQVRLRGRLALSELGRFHAPDQVTELGWLLVLAALWGSSYTLIKVAVETVPPLSVVAARVSVAAVVLLLLARHQGLRLPHDSWTWRACFVQAALLNFVPFTLISWSEQYIDSSLAGILNATPPLFTFVLTRLWTRHEPASNRQLAGVALGAVGVVLIVGTDALGGLSQHTGAEFAVLLASVCYALAAIWGRRLAQLSPVVTTAGTMTCAAAVMLPVSLVVDQPWRLAPSAESLGALVTLAILSTAIANMVYFRLLRTIGSIGTTSNSYLRAAASVALGYIALRERPGATTTAGLALVLAGVATMVGRPMAPSHSTDSTRSVKVVGVRT
jgi:drug/metabolite transporter (DMT)-like permease